ncbi:hypothetical protein BaRGS_00018485 [Batillaria attramentaria]|uniref:Uncharacterized protein n=1 Tax=Batillaria attramentaria TaxID=370345 RepID=A0ABD0KSX6_9CAEN
MMAGRSGTKLEAVALVCTVAFVGSAYSSAIGTEPQFSVNPSRRQKSSIMADKRSACLGNVRLATFLTLLTVFVASEASAGLRTRSFLGFHDILEVECTEDGLDSGFDVLSMSLFVGRTDRVLASLNLKTGTCLTSDRFSSCQLGTSDSGKTSLRTLVADLPEGGARSIGCNVTCFVPGGRVKTITWFTSVAAISRNEKCGHVTIGNNAPKIPMFAQVGNENEQV